MIDVDDRRYVALSAMRSSPAYGEIRQRYPNVNFWPGDRGASVQRRPRAGGSSSSAIYCEINATPAPSSDGSVSGSISVLGASFSALV